MTTLNNKNVFKSLEFIQSKKNLFWHFYVEFILTILSKMVENNRKYTQKKLKNWKISLV